MYFCNEHEIPRHEEDEDVWYIDGGQRFASAPELQGRRYYNTLITDWTKNQNHIPPLPNPEFISTMDIVLIPLEYVAVLLSMTGCVLEVVYIFVIWNFILAGLF